jgi:cytochrome c oxidase subunit 1
MDGEPSNKTEFPGPTIWPFVAAIFTSIMFIGSIFTAWAVPIGTVPIAIALILWFWPHAPGHDIGAPEEESTPVVEARAS